MRKTYTKTLVETTAAMSLIPKLANHKDYPRLVKEVERLGAVGRLQ